MRLDARLSRSEVYGLYLSNCVEILCVYHQVTDNFTKVADLYTFVPKEYISGISPNGCYRFSIYPCQEDLHVKSLSEVVGTYLFV